MRSKILFISIGICLGILLAFSPLKNINYANLLSSTLDDCNTEQEALTHAQDTLHQNQTALSALPSAETLNTQREELQGQLTSTQNTIKALQKENTSLTPALTVKEYNGNTIVYKSPEHFEWALQTKKTTVSGLEKQSANLQREISRLSAIKPQTSTIQKQIQTYNNRISINNATIINLKKDIQTMEQLLPKIQKLKANLTQITTLQATSSRIQSDISAIQTQANNRLTLETEQPSLQQAVDDAQQALDACQNGGGEVCGNGVEEGEEQCDDGNTIDGDGCENNCQKWCDKLSLIQRLNMPEESIVFCPVIGDIRGSVTTYTRTSECPTRPVVEWNICWYVLNTCGNNTVDEWEQCDDGNTTNGDGCSALCVLEEVAVCGNGKIEPPEECETDADVPEGYICLDCKKAEVRNP